MNKVLFRDILKYSFALAALFVFFLLSGGLYHTSIAKKVRVHKITGAVEVLKTKNGLVGWHNINEDAKPKTTWKDYQ